MSQFEIEADPTTGKINEFVVAVYWHPECSDHNIPDHPESPLRVESILTALQAKFADKLLYRKARSVSKEEILLFHTPRLLADFEKLSYETILSYETRNLVKYKSIDMDTRVMWQTRAAAYYAAGSVVHAIDDLYVREGDANKIDSAFCCVRPPGHHAERDKACGFCFFNNVAIGAKYAQKAYGVQRVAVLDFDVHHGNGTEEGFTVDKNMFYGSTHGRDHFPGTGADPTPFVGDKAKRDIDRRIVNRMLTPGPPSRSEFRNKWQEILIEMERFDPDLVIMSAGFDAHDDDPLASCELIDEDFSWVTKEIIASCSRISNHRKSSSIRDEPVVDGDIKSTDENASSSSFTRCKFMSVLEGGYDMEAIQRCAVCHVEALLEGYHHSDTIASQINNKKKENSELKNVNDCGEIVALREYMESLGIA